MAPDLLNRALIYVTGKGGVGKTTVAASLGVAAAAQGKRTIVCEVAEQSHMSRAFAHAGVSREKEAQLAPDLYAITVDPQHALEEWLGRQVGGGAMKIMTRSQAFGYFIAAAPGAKELITIAKVWELAQLDRWSKSGRTYDLVIVDAPASGHGIAMLQTPSTFGDIARVGPIQRQAYKVRDMLRDPARTGYVAVALPEELPVNETIELEARVREAVGIGLDAVVVNGVWPSRLPGEGLDRVKAVAGSSSAPAPLEAAIAADERARVHASQVRRLRREVDAPVLTLPFLFQTELELDDYAWLGEKIARKLP
jgi:anion-transporting  ArsA/GET3 family ATPase